jgi:hypothetical protein
MELLIMNEGIECISNKNVPIIIVGILTLCSQWKEGIEAKINHWLWWKAMSMNDLFQWWWIFIGDGLGRMTMGSHSILSYHVPSHNMLKWIILIQNMLYNYL